MLVVAFGLGFIVAGTSLSKNRAATDVLPDLSYYADLVEELDLRRWVNVLFPNKQTLFDGLQVGFVNVSSGNLTFQRRDLVVMDTAPVVFARVYDSRLKGEEDFGRGWRLSLAEELMVVDELVLHADNSSSLHRFKRSGDRYVPDPPSPESAGRSIITSLGGGTALLLDVDGTERTFERSPLDANRYRIVRLRSPLQTLDFHYAEERLSAVTSGSRMLFHIQRESSDSRIRTVTDAHGTNVEYSYGRDGMLNEVVDLAGNPWRLTYDDSGRLEAAIGANGVPYLEVRYDALGRVVRSRTGRDYRFRYSHSSTTVTEGTGRDYVFQQNNAGATVAFQSDNGTAWSLNLDSLNRVRELATQDRVIHYAYSDQALIAEIVHETAAGRERRRFAYDHAGRLTEAVSNRDGTVSVNYAQDRTSLSGSVLFEYDMTPFGVVTAVYDGHSWIDAEYAAKVGLTGLFRNDQSTKFERAPSGRITGTRFANGGMARYSHDDLGNRSLVEYGGGGAVRYVHDPAGNIVEVEVEAPNGTFHRQRVTVGSMNQVERIHYIDSHTLHIEYDGMGRPVAFETADDSVLVHYDLHGNLARLISEATGMEWEPEERLANASPKQDARRTVLSGDMVGTGHPEYGVLAFSETTFEPYTHDILELGVPGLAKARRLQAVAMALFEADGTSAVAEFERASNPVFQPPQYLATNCCIRHPGSSSTAGPSSMAQVAAEVSAPV